MWLFRFSGFTRSQTSLLISDEVISFSVSWLNFLCLPLDSHKRSTEDLSQWSPPPQKINQSLLYFLHQWMWRLNNQKMMPEHRGNQIILNQVSPPIAELWLGSCPYRQTLILSTTPSQFFNWKSSLPSICVVLSHPGHVNLRKATELL